MSSATPEKVFAIGVLECHSTRKTRKPANIVDILSFLEIYGANLPQTRGIAFFRSIR
jgi:hypothetical protein